MEGEVGGIRVARYLPLITRLERGQAVMVQLFFDNNTGQVTHAQLVFQESDGGWGAPYPMEVASHGSSSAQNRH